MLETISSYLNTGRLLAEISVFISCAMSLAVFNITPHIENGMPVIPDLTQTTGVIRYAV